MLFDENDMLSASALNRNPARYVALAEAGRRQIILRDNAPVAGIVSIDDLRRLDRLDNQLASMPPLGATLPAPDTLGTTTIGVNDDGTPVALPLAANHLIVGAAGSGKTAAIGAMIAGARPAHPTKYLIVTSGMPFTFAHPIASVDDVAVTFEQRRGDGAVLGEVLGDTIAERRKLLAQHGAKNLDELRAAGHAAAVANFVVILDTTMIPNLSDPLGMLHLFGISLWATMQHPHGGALSPYSPTAFDYRIALRTLTPGETQRVIQSPNASTIPDSEPGTGYLQTMFTTNTHRPMKFRFTEPAPSPHHRVQGLDDPCDAATQLGILSKQSG